VDCCQRDHARAVRFLETLRKSLQRAVIPTSVQVDPPRMVPGSSGCSGELMESVVMDRIRADTLNMPEKKSPQ
jgi:hypothetical protein